MQAWQFPQNTLDFPGQCHRGPWASWDTKEPALPPGQMQVLICRLLEVSLERRTFGTWHDSCRAVLPWELMGLFHLLQKST